MEERLTVLKRLIPPRAARPKDFLFYGKRIWLQEKGVVRCVIANSLQGYQLILCVWSWEERAKGDQKMRITQWGKRMGRSPEPHLIIWEVVSLKST